MDREEQITRILDRYKCMDRDDVLCLIPILDEAGAAIGFLRPITADFKTTIADCVKLLDQWRLENPTLSPSRFPITHDRTERWIKNEVIHNNRRILFLVQNLNGQYIGHMGFTAICPKENSAEIDLVVRGVRDVQPGLMRYAMNALISWGKRELQLEHVAVMVLWDNERGIAFYQRCGFTREEIIPLTKVESGDDISWIPCKDASDKGEKYYYHMRLC